jgi:hypothetical protein
MSRRIVFWSGVIALTFAVARVPAQEQVALTSATMARPAGVKHQLQTLAGPLPRFIKAKGSPYLVTGNIEVPPERTVVIEPGTVLLFRNFCGLHVQGRLIAEGSRDKPIVFTSEYDRSFNPASERDANPFDWDGVYIHPDGFGSRLSYSKIFYAVYGFVSETKYIRLDPVAFRDNGQTRVTIDRTEYGVSEAPFKYVLSTKDAVKDGVPVDIFKDPAAPRRNFLRYAGISLFFGGCAAGAWELNETRKAEANLAALTQETDRNLIQNGEEEFQDAQQTRDLHRSLSIASLGLGLLGMIGFCWSFGF